MGLKVTEEQKSKMKHGKNIMFNRPFMRMANKKCHTFPKTPRTKRKQKQAKEILNLRLKSMIA